MLLIELPITEYSRAMEIQDRLVRWKLDDGGPDVLLMLEHPPVITLGKRASSQDLRISPQGLAARGLVVQSTDRGGEATYHGPGQIVCYPIMDLRKRKMRIRDFVQRLEETVISTLACFGVRGFRQEKMVGVWTGPSEKIASIGVRIRKGVTSHGFSLNVNMTLDPAELIVVCGSPAARMVSLSQLVDRPPEMGQVKETISQSFEAIFGVTLTPTSLPSFSRVPSGVNAS
jgi:lipoate-protein ligase B